jgi:hypothetical protein
MKLLIRFIAVMALTAWTGVSQAGVIFSYTEVGSDLVGNLSGTLDLTGAATTQTMGTDAFDQFLRPNEAFLVGGGGTFDYVGYSITGPASFGSSGTFLGIYTGDLFVIDGFYGDLRLSSGFTVGALSGTMTLANTAISDLGLTGDNFVYLLSNGETATVTFTASSQVPLPGTLVLMGLGLAGLGWSKRRKA